MAQTFLLEIGTEELPSSAIKVIERDGVAALAKLLDDAGLFHGDIELIITPRRIAFLVSKLAESTEAITQTFIGPSKKIAYTNDGKLTKAGEGFLRSKGIGEKEVTFDESDRMVAHIDQPAVSAVSFLEEALPAFIESFNFKRTQRWGEVQVRFVRPVRSIVALLGQKPLAVSFGDVQSGTHISGHRILSPEGADIRAADTYKETLRRLHVLEQKARAKKIEHDIKEYEKAQNVSVSRPTASFEEVVNLVEWPTLLEAEFDSDFLAIPQEIISESLLSHQRYFPVIDKEGRLTQKFIVIGNADPAKNEQVVKGNERVVRARLDDARFFYEADVALGLSKLASKLNQVTFHQQLGSLADKVNRLAKLAPRIATLLGGSAQECDLAKRAAELMKADLVSQTVIEFTNQQGVVGSYIARAQGEDEAIVQAIASQYMPRFAGDALPEGLLATAVSLADKIDTLAGLFAINEIPTGSRDPFAVRRQAIGILNMLLSYPSFDMQAAFNAAFLGFEQQGISFKRKEAQEQLLLYFSARLNQMAKEAGIAPDIIQALFRCTENPADFFVRAKAFSQVREAQMERFEQLVQTYARAAHLSDPTFGMASESTNKTEAQKKLHKKLVHIQKEIKQAQDQHNYQKALNVLLDIKQPLDDFFDSTLIMDKDETVREANLKLLNSIRELFENIAHFDALSKQEK